jgi:hypothetical protein
MEMISWIRQQAGMPVRLYPAFLLFRAGIQSYHRRFCGRSRKIEKDVGCARLFFNNRVKILFKEDVIWIFLQAKLNPCILSI